MDSEITTKMTITRQRERGNYNINDDETRCKTGRYGSMHGNTTAACHFSKEMGMKIAKGTLRGMRKKLVILLKTKLNQALTQPTRGPLGK